MTDKIISLMLRVVFGALFQSLRGWLYRSFAALWHRIHRTCGDCNKWIWLKNKIFAEIVVKYCKKRLFSKRALLFRPCFVSRNTRIDANESVSATFCFFFSVFGSFDFYNKLIKIPNRHLATPRFMLKHENNAKIFCSGWLMQCLALANAKSCSGQCNVLMVWVNTNAWSTLWQAKGRWKNTHDKEPEIRRVKKSYMYTWPVK